MTPDGGAVGRVDNPGAGGPPHDEPEQERDVANGQS